MHYQEDREKSAEILRLAVAHMGKQEAAFHPTAYTLWYEHAAGINPGLSLALEERLGVGGSLTDADVLRLHNEHVVGRDGQAVERIQQRLLVLLQETGQAVSQSGTHAAHFGNSLEGHAARLQQPRSWELLQQIVGELLTETQHMSAANRTLSQRLDSSAQEVFTLSRRVARLQAEALRDPLTGLLNRRGFDQAIADLDARHPQLRGATLVLIDIDQFKQINDGHGHLVGDQVLRAVARVLCARTKGADITARLGGDEFVVLLPDTPVAGAQALAEQIRKTLGQVRLRQIGRQDHNESITVSLGVASAAGGMSLEKLLENADTALYAAKRGGRNRVVVAARGSQEA